MIRKSDILLRFDLKSCSPAISGSSLFMLFDLTLLSSWALQALHKYLAACRDAVILRTPGFCSQLFHGHGDALFRAVEQQTKASKQVKGAPSRNSCRWTRMGPTWGVSGDAGMTVCTAYSRAEAGLNISLCSGSEGWKMEPGEAEGRKKREWGGSIWLWGGCRGLGMGRVPACFISGWQDFALPFSLSLPLSFILCYSFSAGPVAPLHPPPPPVSLLLSCETRLGEKKGLDKFKGKKNSGGRCVRTLHLSKRIIVVDLKFLTWLKGNKDQMLAKVVWYFI